MPELEKTFKRAVEGSSRAGLEAVKPRLVGKLDGGSSARGPGTGHSGLVVVRDPALLRAQCVPSSLCRRVWMGGMEAAVEGCGHVGYFKLFH